MRNHSDIPGMEDKTPFEFWFRVLCEGDVRPHALGRVGAMADQLMQSGRMSTAIPARRTPILHSSHSSKSRCRNSLESSWKC
jgi:hypothetical protein